MSLARIPTVKYVLGIFFAMAAVFSSSSYALTSLCYDEFRGPDRYIVHKVDYSAFDASAGTHVGLRTVPLSPAGGAVQLAYPVSPSGGSRTIDMIMGTGLYSFTGEGFIGNPQLPDFVYTIESNMCAHTVYSSPGASSPPSVGINITPSVVTEGDSVTVTWGSIGASACYFDAISIPLGGVASFAAALSDDRTYTLECVNSWGWSYAAADLTVNEFNPYLSILGVAGIVNPAIVYADSEDHIVNNASCPELIGIYPDVSAICPSSLTLARQATYLWYHANFAPHVQQKIIAEGIFYYAGLRIGFSLSEISEYYERWGYMLGLASIAHEFVSSL